MKANSAADYHYEAERHQERIACVEPVEGREGSGGGGAAKRSNMRQPTLI